MLSSGLPFGHEQQPMSIEFQLREKLRKIEALFVGASTAGERLAAEAALERVRVRLAELGRRDPPIEMQFSMSDSWSRHLFLALAGAMGWCRIGIIASDATRLWCARRKALLNRFYGRSFQSSTGHFRSIFTR
jgi:hypothetical protein